MVRFPNALIAAIYYGHKGFVTLLLDNYVSTNQPRGYINAEIEWYGYALQAVIIYCDQPMVQLLLEYGADVNVQGGRHGNPLQAAALPWGNKDIVQLLLGRGANINARGGEYGNAFQASIASNNLDIAELLAQGAKVDQPGPEWETLLFRVRNSTPWMPLHGAFIAEKLPRYQNDPTAYITERRQELEKDGEERLLWKKTRVANGESLQNH